MRAGETNSTLGARRRVSMHVNTDSSYLSNHQNRWEWCPDSAHHDTQQSVRAIDNLRWLNAEYMKELAEMKQQTNILDSSAIDSLRSKYADRLFRFRLESCLAKRERIMIERGGEVFAVT